MHRVDGFALLAWMTTTTTGNGRKAEKAKEEVVTEFVPQAVAPRSSPNVLIKFTNGQVEVRIRPLKCMVMLPLLLPSQAPITVRGVAI